MSKPNPQELEIFLEVATEAALAGGVIVRHYWGNLQAIHTKGPSGNLVTEADQASEQKIVEILQRHFPHHGILAEESGIYQGRAHQYLWAIDPLDGTTNYAHGYPQVGVSIGLVVAGVPVVGVIYNPLYDELYRGAQGLGATLNGQAIAVSATEKLEDSLLVTGFAYDRCEVVENNYAEFMYLTHLTQGVRRSGAASMDLAAIACGRLDGYWERGLSPWDLAAGVVLVQEAGGQVSAYDQGKFELQSGRILATNGKIHQQLSGTLHNTKNWVRDQWSYLRTL